MHKKLLVVVAFILFLLAQMSSSKSSWEMGRKRNLRDKGFFQKTKQFCERAKKLCDQVLNEEDGGNDAYGQFITSKAYGLSRKMY